MCSMYVDVAINHLRRVHSYMAGHHQHVAVAVAPQVAAHAIRAPATHFSSENTSESRFHLLRNNLCAATV